MSRPVFSDELKHAIASIATFKNCFNWNMRIEEEKTMLTLCWSGNSNLPPDIADDVSQLSYETSQPPPQPPPVRSESMHHREFKKKKSPSRLRRDRRRLDKFRMMKKAQRQTGPQSDTESRIQDCQEESHNDTLEAEDSATPSASTSAEDTQDSESSINNTNAEDTQNNEDSIDNSNDLETASHNIGLENIENESKFEKHDESTVGESAEESNPPKLDLDYNKTTYWEHIKLAKSIVEELGQLVNSAEFTDIQSVNDSNNLIYKWYVSGREACNIILKMQPYMDIPKGLLIRTTDMVVEFQHKLNAHLEVFQSKLPVYKLE